MCLFDDLVYPGLNGFTYSLSRKILLPFCSLAKCISLKCFARENSRTF